MKRLSASARVAITRQAALAGPSSQSGGRGSRCTRLPRLPAIDLIGASELFSSWPSTRISRCQACALLVAQRLADVGQHQRDGGAVRAAGTACAAPPSVRCAPGKRDRARCAATPDRSQSSEVELLGVRSSSRSAGVPSSRSPARLTSCSRWRSSKVKTATSISAITLRSSAVASSASRRCPRSISASAFTSSVHVVERIVAARAARADREVALAQRRQQVGDGLQRHDDAGAQRREEAERGSRR